MSWRSLIAVLFVASVSLLTAGPAVHAWDDRYEILRQQRSLFQIRPSPQPTVVQPQPAQPRTTTRRRPTNQQPLVADADKPKVEASIFVHVLGDSLAELAAQGLKDAYADRPEVAIVRRTRSSSGLVRDDYYDWQKSAAELMASPEKVDVAVIMLGSNDRQVLREENGTSHEPRTDRWQELYVKRLDALLAQFSAKGVPVVWIGMPVMQSSRLTADMLYLNDLFRQRVQKAGFVYSDIWEGFTNEAGQYASTGPDIAGEIVRLRTADGVHFTRAGMRKVAFFADKEISRLITRDTRPELALPQPDTGPSLTPPVNPQAPSVASLTPLTQPAEPITRSTEPLISIPVPLVDTTAPLAVLGRPVTGQVLSLSQPPRAQEGRLVGGNLPQPLTDAQLQREMALVYGRAPVPKPGRADDFSWPR
jgi:hypothetical protein